MFPSRPQYLAGLDCAGAESSLLECIYDTPLGTACHSGRGVQVTCVAHSTTDDNGPGVNKAEGEECIQSYSVSSSLYLYKIYIK